MAKHCRICGKVTTALYSTPTPKFIKTSEQWDVCQDCLLCMDNEKSFWERCVWALEPSYKYKYRCMKCREEYGSDFRPDTDNRLCPNCSLRFKKNRDKVGQW